jgi:hypothetical protein
VARSGGKVYSTRTPHSGSDHTPARYKAKGAGGLDPKSMEALIKYVIG